MGDNDCCPPGSWPGTVEDASRKVDGTETKLLTGLNVYETPVSSDTAADKAIVVVYDIFGFSGGRIKSVCDALALETKMRVIMPDFYGDEDKLFNHGGFGTEGGVEFLAQQNWGKLQLQLEETYGYLQGQGVKSIGMIGFCWGAWVGFKASVTGKVKACVSCHPSVHKVRAFGPSFAEEETETELAKSIKCPQLFLPAGNDPKSYSDGTLAELVRANGIECKEQLFADMKHGFVVRGDASDPAVARDVEAAVKAASAFFQQHV